MNAQQAPRIFRLESDLSDLAGTPVRITIRGKLSFTWSTEDRNEVAAEKLAGFASKYPGATVTVHHDDECGSYVYVDIAERPTSGS